ATRMAAGRWRTCIPTSWTPSRARPRAGRAGGTRCTPYGCWTGIQHETNERFLIEGFELSASYPARLAATLENVKIRVCFLGNRSFSTDDLAGYRGPKPQHRGASRAELSEAATWIRQRSEQLYEECLDAGVVYI